MMLTVTSVTAAILALFYVYLSIRIIHLRRQLHVSLGDGGHQDISLAIRAHGNFSEYVPISLILLACAELNQANRIILVLLALAVITGRAFHARAFLSTSHHFRYRKTGMVLTFNSIVLLSIYNFVLVILQGLTGR